MREGGKTALVVKVNTLLPSQNGKAARHKTKTSVTNVE